MLKSRLCDYSDLYILVKQNITVVGAGTTNFQIFLTYYFYPWIEIIRKEYNLIEYKVYYSKSFRRL